MFDWIVRIISEVLLFWHSVWHFLLPDGKVLGTDWQWILGIVFLVISIRVVLFPIFVKQIKSQRAMQAIQPKVKELQTKHKGDRETLNKEMMELYRKEKANPLMGCLPMVLQIPVFIGLFRTLNALNPKNSGAPGWNAAQFKSATAANLFWAPIAAKFKSTGAELSQLHASGATVKIVAGLLVAIMIATTYLTSRQMILKTGWAEDPQQKMVQRLMLYGIPVSLLVSGSLFPIGVIIYWVTNNLFSLAQQQWVLRKFPPPPNASKSATAKAGDAGKGAKAAPAGGKSGASRDATPQADPAIDGKAMAPKPGAKPVNPKKGGAKRPTG